MEKRISELIIRVETKNKDEEISFEILTNKLDSDLLSFIPITNQFIKNYVEVYKQMGYSRQQAIDRIIKQIYVGW